MSDKKKSEWCRVCPQTECTRAVRGRARRCIRVLRFCSCKVYSTSASAPSMVERCVTQIPQLHSRLQPTPVQAAPKVARPARPCIDVLALSVLCTAPFFRTRDLQHRHRYLTYLPHHRTRVRQHRKARGYARKVPRSQVGRVSRKHSEVPTYPPVGGSLVAFAWHIGLGSFRQSTNRNRLQNADIRPHRPLIVRQSTRS